MRYIEEHPPTDEPDAGLSVVIAYEDFETGKQAKRTYDFLAEALGGDFRLTNQMWKFDVLSLPGLRELATADAVAADIVLIACHGDELPAHTREWIESWSGGPDRPLALIALLDPAEGRVQPAEGVRGYLAEIARRGDIEFFAPAAEPIARSTFPRGSGSRCAELLRRVCGRRHKGVRPLSPPAYAKGRASACLTRRCRRGSSGVI